jgi:hypothetical protein
VVICLKVREMHDVCRKVGRWMDATVVLGGQGWDVLERGAFFQSQAGSGDALIVIGGWRKIPTNQTQSRWHRCSSPWLYLVQSLTWLSLPRALRVPVQRQGLNERGYNYPFHYVVRSHGWDKRRGARQRAACGGGRDDIASVLE